MDEIQLRETLARASDDLRHSPQCTVRLLRPMTLLLAGWGLRRRTNPNLLTLCMLLTVLVALPLFCLSHVIPAIIGLLLIQWFEIFDDADGIVARGTGQLSVCGEQLDYLMHLFCHPLSQIVFAFAVWRTLPAEPMLPCLPFSNAWLLVLLAAIFALTEYGMRALTELCAVTRLKRTLREESAEAPPPRGLHALISANLFCYPVFMQLFPILLVVDLLAGTHIAFWTYAAASILWLLYYGMHACLHLFRYMRAR